MASLVPPSAVSFPGFTHEIDGVRPVRSRLDYLWCNGIDAASIQQVHIDTRLRSLSHHHLLWMQLRTLHPIPSSCSTPLLRLRLPNLRAASDEQKDTLARRIEQQLEQQQHSLLLESAASDDPAALSDVASYLTSLVRRCAFDTLPITGDKPYNSQCALQLRRQRRDLTALLRISHALLAPCSTAAAATSTQQWLCSPEWRRQYARCMQQHRLHWRCDAWYCGDTAAWLAETHQLLSRTRAAMKQEQHRMMRATRFSTAHHQHTGAAHVHRMLKSDALPAQLLSVVDPNGQLTSTAAELEHVMVEHFTSVFASPPPSDAPLPQPPPAMLFDKPSVQPEWYDGLMAAVTADELLTVLRDVPLVSAPGEDEVSSGVWKVVLQRSKSLQTLVATLFSSCLRSGSFPVAWKTSIIVPLLKDAQKERSMSNVRPISLQSCLGKLLNKLLAHRLGSIFARHPILNSAQRGFINGGSISKCIDELLDAWDWSRGSKGHQLLCLFYDIQQAYDSVQKHVLQRAMRRLRMPQSFIDLVVDSLTGLTSCVRTPYGHSRSFHVRRSLRQGDPLAPLLFVILMDALHEGLECNPFDGQRHGLIMQFPDGEVVELPSLGYADDTNILANDLPSLCIQNEWVHYFMTFNEMRLNHSKCELVGRDAAGEPVTAAAVAMHGITIDGRPLLPVPHDHPIRYLGVLACFDGSWDAQRKKTLGTIASFTRAATKFRVPLSQAVCMFNTFLMPVLELALHYVHGAGTNEWISNCDRLLFGCIKHAVSSPISLSHRAVALSLGLLLPSRLEAAIKVSELFLRINSLDPRWGQLGRLLMRTSCGSAVSAASSLPQQSTQTRITRAAVLAVQGLGWSLHLSEQQRRAAGRQQHLFDSTPVAGAFPSLEHCSSSQPLRLHCGATMHVAHDVWQGWGATAAAETVHAYTDGSYDASSLPHSTSAWAVTLADDWLHGSYGSIPADEQLVRPWHVAGAAMTGASIACTRGIYPAELQAIARVLAMLPASFTMHVHSDSKSSSTLR